MACQPLKKRASEKLSLQQQLPCEKQRQGQCSKAVDQSAHLTTTCTIINSEGHAKFLGAAQSTIWQTDWLTDRLTNWLAHCLYSGFLLHCGCNCAATLCHLALCLTCCVNVGPSADGVPWIADLITAKSHLKDNLQLNLHYLIFLSYFCTLRLQFRIVRHHDNMPF